MSTNHSHAPHSRPNLAPLGRYACKDLDALLGLCEGLWHLAGVDAETITHRRSTWSQRHCAVWLTLHGLIGDAGRGYNVENRYAAAVALWPGVTSAEQSIILDDRTMLWVEIGRSRVGLDLGHLPDLRMGLMNLELSTLDAEVAEHGWQRSVDDNHPCTEKGRPVCCHCGSPDVSGWDQACGPCSPPL